MRVVSNLPQLAGSLLLLATAGCSWREEPHSSSPTPPSFAVHIAARLVGIARDANGGPIRAAEIVVRAGQWHCGDGVVAQDGRFEVFVTGGTAPEAKGCVEGSEVRFFLGNRVARESFTFAETGGSPFRLT